MSQKKKAVEFELKSTLIRQQREQKGEKRKEILLVNNQKKEHL